MLSTDMIAQKWRRFAAADTKRKIRLAIRWLGRLSLQLFAFFLHVGLRLISLGRPVRIGTFNAQGKISVTIGNIEPHVRKLQVEGVRNPFVIVINTGKCPNKQLSKMYRRAVWLLDDKHPQLRSLFTIVHRILLKAGSRIALQLFHDGGQNMEFHRAWQEGEPLLQLTTEENERGQRLIQDMGIPEGASYICFGVRESSYYHQWKDPNLELYSKNLNAPLENYIPMAAQCADSGLYVLRMGQVVDKALLPGLNPKVIDYAANCRAPFGDIYLLANCKFVVTGGTGLWSVASAFNRPVVWTEQYFLWGTTRADDLFIPKKLWVISDKRFLTFREMLTVGPLYLYEEYCVRDGVELVHSTPEEITAVVLEMNQRLDGTWQSCDEDEELQRRFKSLYPPHMISRIDKRVGFFQPTVRVAGRIGAEFLRYHAYLLD